MATEAGIAAADAAIQHTAGTATRPYVVEDPPGRADHDDLRGSEIMEMTIARDRWQQHLKSGGRYYADLAARLDTVHATHPGVGADIAALACRALVVVLDACRAGRLTRSQHVLFRLGEEPSPGPRPQPSSR